MTTSLSSGWVMCISLFFSLQAFATTYVPNTFTDPVITSVNNATGAINGGALISFRSALLAADNLGGMHTVTLSTGTYLLNGSATYTVPSLGTFSGRAIYLGNRAQNITINGNGPTLTIIEMAASGRDRIMTINYDGVAPDVLTTFNGVKFLNGYLTHDEYGGAALYAGPIGGLFQSLVVNNCAFEGNISPSTGNGGSGGAIYMFQETLIVNNCTFTNNSAGDGVGGAIVFILYNNQGNDGRVKITNCTFTGNSARELGGAIHVTGQGGQPAGTIFSVNVSHNTFINNFTTIGLGGAVTLNNSANISVFQAHYNRFAGNTSALSPLSSAFHFPESSGSVNAENNWWGCNSNPVSGVSTAPCNQAGGDVPGGGSLDADPWLQLKVTAAPASICNGLPSALGNTSNITASFLTNSSGTAISTDSLTRIIGLPITWGPTTLGSLSGQQVTIQPNGTATALFTSNGTGGTATINAEVDNVPTNETSPARASITVNTIPIVTLHPQSQTVCDPTMVSFTSTASGSPTPSLQWQLSTNNGMSFSNIGGATS